MYNKIAINLGWSSDGKIEENYYKWLNICKKHNINFVRIFLCSWSINALYNKKYITVLNNVISHALEKKIEVCIVLNNFVDYNIKNYSDINDKHFSWISNPYYNKYKKQKNFFQTLDNNYLSQVINILKLIYKYDNVKYIEVMNEIDQIHCSNNILINCANLLIENLTKKFQDRYIYTCSISNHMLLTKFKEKMNCYIDLHMYSFPYENAIENIEYIINKHSVLYLGEYAKHSDSSYINDIDSKTYFISGLWGSYFYNLTYTPMHWWWEEILNNSDYLVFIDIYNLISHKLDAVKKVEKINLQYKIYGKPNKFNQSEKNKIKERLNNLIKHPLFVINELKSIKKFVIKKGIKQHEVVFRKIMFDNDYIYYLECNNNIMINKKIHKKYIIDLKTGKKRKYNNKIEKGNYLIF